MSRLVLYDCLGQRIHSLLIDDAFHHIVESLEANVTHLVLFGEKPHPANQVHSLRLLGVQSEFLDRLNLHTEPISAQPNKILLLIFIFADQKLESVGIDSQKVVLEKLHTVSVGRQNLRPIFVEI